MNTIHVNKEASLHESTQHDERKDADLKCSIP